MENPLFEDESGVIKNGPPFPERVLLDNFLSQKQNQLESAFEYLNRILLEKIKVTHVRSNQVRIWIAPDSFLKNDEKIMFDYMHSDLPLHKLITVKSLGCTVLRVLQLYCRYLTNLHGRSINADGSLSALKTDIAQCRYTILEYPKEHRTQMYCITIQVNF